MEELKNCQCPACQKRWEEEQKSEEQMFAILIALVPMMTVALFGNLGIF